MIREHIKSLPVKTSVDYLSSESTDKTMHCLFLTKYPELKEIIKYKFYLRYFNEYCNLKFERPQGATERLGV